jgi:ketosteroid isomerase-like protein
MNLRVFISIFPLFFLLSCGTPTSIDKEAGQNDQFLNVSDDVINRCKFNDLSIDPLPVVQNAYGYLFSGNLQQFLDCLSDDVVWIHYGPHGTLPTFNTYYGKSGVTQWATNLMTSFQMNYFNIHYFVAEGNKVQTQVMEGAYSYGAGTQMYIENSHLFEINSSGKISRALIISESYTAVSAFNGVSGTTYTTKYANSDFQSDYTATLIDEIKAYKFMIDLNHGIYSDIKNYFSSDAEIVLTGPEDLVPYMGKFTGFQDIQKFTNKISKEIYRFDIQYIIKQNNKINVYFKLYGISRYYKKPYDSDALFSFQMNDKGKISKIYGYTNCYTISRAYLR